MQRRLTLEVEASTGVAVRAGERVRRGQEIGTRPDFAGRVLVPEDGVVTGIGFIPEKHVFAVEIEPAIEPTEGTSHSGLDEYNARRED